jgi:tryptophan synthase alpha chain
MGYMNSFLSLKNNLAKELNQAGVDGVIVVDLPYDESKSFFNNLKKENIDLIRLISPTTDLKRLKRMLASSSGYLYYVSLKGITGAELKNFNEVKNKVKKIKSLTNLPVVVGFGIKDASIAKKMASFSDGIVVGTKIIDFIEKKATTKISNFTKSLKKAIN